MPICQSYVMEGSNHYVLAHSNINFQLLTRTRWWAIPVVWLPVVFWCVTTSIRVGRTLPEVGLTVVGGILLWTLIEYTLHRFLFHMKTKSYWWVNFFI